MTALFNLRWNSFLLGLLLAIGLLGSAFTLLSTGTMLAQQGTTQTPEKQAGQDCPPKPENWWDWDLDNREVDRKKNHPSTSGNVYVRNDGPGTMVIRVKKEDGSVRSQTPVPPGETATAGYLQSDVVDFIDGAEQGEVGSEGKWYDCRDAASKSAS